MPKIDIGNGWYEAVDPKSGRKYYINKIKKSTQWKRPSDEELGRGIAGKKLEDNDASQHSSPGKSSKKQQIDAWQKRIDKRTNRVYYVNKVTRQSQWEKPTNYKEPQDLNQQTVAAATNKEATTVVIKPNKVKIGSWQVRQDKKGRIYYANMITKSTQWKKPVQLSAYTVTFPLDGSNPVVEQKSARSNATVSKVAEDGVSSATFESSSTASNSSVQVERKQDNPTASSESVQVESKQDINSSLHSMENTPESTSIAAEATVTESNVGSQPTKKNVLSKPQADSSPCSQNDSPPIPQSVHSPLISTTTSDNQPDLPNNSSNETKFGDLSNYILGKTGNVQVKSIGAERTNRGWGENVVVDLRDIIDVKIDDETLGMS